jgi:large subunit ribosomal protein L31
MKNDIHPKYYSDCKVSCACGNVFTTGSTLKEIKVDICAACHPFFTGKMKFIDTMGRVEKFQKRQAAAKKQGFVKKADRKKHLEAKEEAQPVTLKEMILKEKKRSKSAKHE